MQQEKLVKIFVMGLDRWREEDDWPLPDTQLRPYYLHSGGRANSAAGDGMLHSLTKIVPQVAEGTSPTRAFSPSSN